MKRYQPAILGGLFIGILSSLPLVSAANLCCCLWVVVGGVLTVYLQRQDPNAQIQTADAVLAGLIAGAIGAVINIGAMMLLYRISGDMMEAQFRALLEQPQFPPELRDRLITLFSGRSMVLLIGAITLPTYAIFSMLGSLLGVAWFRKKPTPPSSSL
jgi:hypothetical protein